MFNLAEYRKNPARLSDLLPWAALVAPGVILNKDGSWQRTLKFRGPDLDSATEEQLVSRMARLNNALKSFGSGFAIYIEAKREPSYPYPEEANFPDPVSLFVDAERREQFANQDENFENKYYLTLQFLPPLQTTNKLANLFFEKTINSESDYAKSLASFITVTNRFLDILRSIVFTVEFLNDTETLTYLHSIISTKNHVVKPPETPMYLDAFLADTHLVGGLALELGDQHLRTISILTFPDSTLPAILEQLNHLPFSYRWVTRFIPLDKTDAEVELKRYKRNWFAKRKGMLQILQEVFSKTESQLVDSGALTKARDADMALQELAADYVVYGYYTATITVMHSDLQKVAVMQREVERVINGLGFTTISETFNAVSAWLSSLPGQAYANVRAPLLHSLNLAHLMPFSAVWAGQESDAHLHAPPLMYTHTNGRTPFRLVNHIGDVGHQMVIGPTGAGKSVLLTMMALQFRRYKNAQVFIFDKGESFLAATLGVHGGFYEVGLNKNSLNFQPLADVDNEAERMWALEWLQGLLINEKISITPPVKQAVWEALCGLAVVPKEQRTLTGLCALLQDNNLRQALNNYTLHGPFGQLLDSDHEKIGNALWQCYEMEELMNMPSIVAPVLSYLFHRLASRFTGQPTLLIIDEAWLFLDHPIFAGKIRDWLKSLRKQNVSVVFATQSVEDALNANITAALLESCPARIFLPNDRVLEPKIKEAYEKLGLNKRQLQILASATPKKQYYYQSNLGNRLFSLELGPIALAFCAASTKEDRNKIKEIIKQYGEENFLAHYLPANGLKWVLDAISA